MMQKRVSFPFQLRIKIFCFLGVGLFFVNACGVTPVATQSSIAMTAPQQEAVSTQIESPTGTAEPTELPGPSYTNPVYKGDFPDPHVILIGDTYYAYSTRQSTSNIPVITSKDLIHWQRLGDALPALPQWVDLNSSNTWAPGVIQIDEKFVMYYAAHDKETDRQCISVGASEKPDGAFLDPNAKALICQRELGGSIDPYPFRDDDGELYLLWKNDGNCCGKEVWLWIQKLDPDGLTLQGEPIKLIVMDQSWERPLIENPAMVKHDGKYYLFYSGNRWESHQYAVGYAVCETIIGPCEKPLDKPWFEFKAPVMGPGGEAFFTDREGNLWMAYHAWTGANVGYPNGQRSLHIDLVAFEGDKPITNGPTYTPQLLP